MKNNPTKITNVALFVTGALLMVFGIGALAGVALRLLWPALLLGVGAAFVSKAVSSEPAP
jgi:hypothetical protein